MSRWQRRIGAIAGVLALTMTLAACGSTTHAAAPAKKKPTAAELVKKDWQDFFSGTTSAAEKVRLLEDGSAFAPVIDAQAKSAIASSASATVSSVSVHGRAATVHYTIDLAGKPVLSNQTGSAVLVGTTWEVGTASFCALLHLEGEKLPACPGG